MQLLPLLQLGYNPIQIREGCTRWCGNVSIPFPFGLEEGCFAREIFHLNCTDKTLILRIMDDYLNVTNVDADQGIIQYTVDYGYAVEFLDTYSSKSLYTDSRNSASLQWAVANETCLQAQHNRSGYACVSGNSACMPVRTDYRGFFGYRCKCTEGFQGNPYVKYGCKGTLSLCVCRRLQHYYKIIISNSRCHYRRLKKERKNDIKQDYCNNDFR